MDVNKQFILPPEISTMSILQLFIEYLKSLNEAWIEKYYVMSVCYLVHMYQTLL